MSRLGQILVAILLPLAAAAVELTAGDVLEPRWLPFAVAVFLASWWGGFWSGLGATALATVLAWWALVVPMGAEPRDLVSVGMLAVTGVLFSEFAGRMRRVARQRRELFEYASDGLFVADPDGRYTEVNTAACLLVGYSRDELVGKTILDLVRPEEADRLWQERETILEEGGLVSEWELVRKDGNRVPVEISATILHDGRWLASVRDISDRRRLERTLRESRNDLERAQAVAQIGSWRLDVTRNELRWSKEAHHIFGIPPGRPLTYEDFLGCVHPDDRAFVDEQWSAALKGAPYDIQHRLLVEGTVKWVRECADLEFDEHGELLGGIGITQDITERRRLEDELRSAEARSSGILEISADAVISVDDQQRITMFNTGAENIFGYSRLEVLGEPLDILVPPRMRALHRGHVERFATGPEQARRMSHSVGEVTCLRKGGEEFPAEGSISKLDLPGGIVMTVALRDVTDLRRTEERLDLALKGGELGAWDWNVRTGEVVFSPRWAEMRGYRLEEIRPHVDTWANDVHPDDMPDVQEALRQHFEGLAPEYEAEHRVRRRDGGWMWVLDRGKVFSWDDQGRPLRMVGVELDITARKRAEAQQRLLAEVGAVFASSLDYDETLGNIAAHIAGTVADLCVMFVVQDHEVRRQKVASRDPALAWVCELIERTPVDPARRDPMWPVLERGEPLVLEELTPESLPFASVSEEHRRAMLALNPRSILIVPLKAHGTLLGAMSLVASEPGTYRPSDLQWAGELASRAALAIDNARLFRTAREASKLRDEVLGVVAHDLRNPLSTIAMRAELMRRQSGDPSAEAIARAAVRMNRLIQDLLDVTRIEAGRLPLEVEAVSASQITREVVHAQRDVASARALDLRLDVETDLPDVAADRHRLLQVFENLIGNALKFTPPGGRIVVSAKRSGDAVRFRVRDTGEGVSEADLPHVFDRFWQARAGRRHGAGLGLPIVKGIVEAHGGSIEVASELGRGTTFTFTIPVSTAQPLTPA